MDLSGNIKKLYKKGKIDELIKKGLMGEDDITYEDYTKRRLLQNIEKENSCWIWKGGKSHGYGRIKVKGKRGLTHRISYQIFRGEIPKGMYVCHICDNPACINPDHLWLGTHSDNMKDAWKKGRINKYNLKFVKYGEEHPKSKLTNKQAIKIKNSELPTRELCNKYGVAMRTIQDIRNGNRWNFLN